ncbi:hypothetical protein DFA_05654 [Cavenderia fasciculata]|uniref:Uncharacterized protein n=1 Tax=Cavenderia fasciculata TaxID=261658 RepID=F4PLW7_CACFS|nr:uncharacterized protein DFA_05654 [Cavenderia fasciculata]EGG23521.1 hypothetical protein DFA_05654 [Cavenderia fasciculata]|eukprot:XP_004361372.1 hypothetical protein DFA_05654 [Cavenderia fasciculata]
MDVVECTKLHFKSPVNDITDFKLTGTFDNGFKVFPMINIEPLEYIHSFTNGNTISSNKSNSYQFIGVSMIAPQWNNMDGQ